MVDKNGSGNTPNPPDLRNIDCKVTRVQEALPYGFADTSFQAAGGIVGIKKLVATFYHILDVTPGAEEVRALYPEDLTRSKEKLGRYLCGWLGGPPKYQEKFGRIKITDAHQRFEISKEHGQAWLECMHKAIDKQGFSPKFTGYFKEQFRLTVDRIVRENASNK